MKKILLLLVTSVALFSCSMKERIVFNEDMTGKYEMSIDLTPMLEFANSMGGGSKNDAKKKNLTYDTIAHFDDFIELYKDSLDSPEKQRLSKLKGLTMQSKFNEESGEAFIKVYKDFDSMDDLNLMHQNFNYAMDKSKQNSGIDGIEKKSKGTPKVNDNVEYSYKRRTFKRTSKALPKNEESNEDDLNKEDNDRFKKMIKMLGKTMDYEIEYVFPRKIKKVSTDKAMISEDGKTLRINYDLQVVLDKPETMSFEVKLK
ncbi:hypothetical protein [Aureivirga sp. CE67]|uniref:hypothetical protein n=1 Tax=Aureivirga sp. CE67 TaxID=1788983 RepID=UPI0018CBBA16|nr:hypothetical protein [Aureivirga sp. CE67]